ASTAILHRGLLALGGLAGDDRELADRNASLSYLAAADAAGFAGVLPLDHHRWGGLVVAGGEDLLTVLTGLLPDDLPGIADVTPQDVVSRAGGTAVWPRRGRRRGVASGRSAGHRAGIARGEPVTTTAGPRGVPSPVRGRVVVAGSSRPWARQLVVAATSRTQDEPSGRKPTPRR